MTNLVEQIGRKYEPSAWKQRGTNLDGPAQAYVRGYNAQVIEDVVKAIQDAGFTIVRQEQIERLGREVAEKAISKSDGKSPEYVAYLTATLFEQRLAEDKAMIQESEGE